MELPEEAREAQEKDRSPRRMCLSYLRNNFATNLENNGVPRNHISQLMGHEDNNLALDVSSGGLAIEILRGSKTKLTYGSEVDSLIGLKLDE